MKIRSGWWLGHDIHTWYASRCTTLYSSSRIKRLNSRSRDDGGLEHKGGKESKDIVLGLSCSRMLVAKLFGLGESEAPIVLQHSARANNCTCQDRCLYMSTCRCTQLSSLLPNNDCRGSIQFTPWHCSMLDWYWMDLGVGPTGTK